MLQPKSREQLKAGRDAIRQANLTKRDSIIKVNQNQHAETVLRYQQQQDGMNADIIAKYGSLEAFQKFNKAQSKLSNQQVEGLDISGANKRGKNKGSCTTGVKNSGDSLKDTFAYGSSGTGGGYIVPPSMTMAQNNIMTAKAEQEAMNNPWIPVTTIAGGLLADNIGSFASLGAKKPKTAIAALGDNNAGGEVEVEGEEVIETPAGEVAEVKGASHEEGGVNMNLPEGTKIYSERVEKFGQSMAERKLAREKKSKNLSKLLEENKNDIAVKNSHARSMQALDKEEAEDLQTQEMYGMMAAVQEYAYGTNADGTRKYGGGTGQFGTDTNSFLGFGKNKFKLGNTITPDAPEFDTSIEGISKGFNFTPTMDDYLAGAKETNSEEKEADLGQDVHLGDIAGVAGNLVSAFGPMKNTLENRATDTPNVNSYTDFGKDALDANLQAMEYAASNKQSALQRIDSQTNGLKRSSRNGARGINQIRATDLAANEQSMSAGLSANDSFMNTMTQLFSQQSGLENQKDSAVMQGEASRDLADRQDKDNFFTQKGKDIASMGEGIQQTGKDLNAVEQNKMMVNVMNNLSKWGLAFDSKGNIVQKTKTTK